MFWDIKGIYGQDKNASCQRWSRYSGGRCPSEIWALLCQYA